MENLYKESIKHINFALGKTKVNMKIAILTDSRGAMGMTPCWKELFVANNPQYECFITRDKNEAFSSLFIHVPIIASSGKNFEVAIIQLGYHEYVIPWAFPYWKEVVAEMDPDYKNHLTLVPDLNLGGHLLHDAFTYRNDVAIGKQFNELRKYCKKLLFIQMPYSWAEYEERTRTMNAVYGACCDASIVLPMDPDFPIKNTVCSGIDRVHYTAEYAKELCEMVEKAIVGLI